jgi:glutathione S-transferase
MYELYIANKNYSSWSLRPWLLMRELGIPFTEHLVPFGDARWTEYRKLSPNGRVPCLIDGKTVVWDSLAIAEYLAEGYSEVWPKDKAARAYARCAAAEMHSAFTELRNRCSMSCGMRIRLKEQPPALARDLARLEALWGDGLTRFGGPFLAGNAFSAADAFFAPVAFRVQGYGLALGTRAAEYVARLLSLPAMKSWYRDALAEKFRDEAHEVEVLEVGTVLEDLRVGI